MGKGSVLHTMELTLLEQKRKFFHLRSTWGYPNDTRHLTSIGCGSYRSTCPLPLNARNSRLICSLRTKLCNSWDPSCKSTLAPDLERRQSISHHYLSWDIWRAERISHRKGSCWLGRSDIMHPERWYNTKKHTLFALHSPLISAILLTRVFIAIVTVILEVFTPFSAAQRRIFFQSAGGFVHRDERNTLIIYARTLPHGFVKSLLKEIRISVETR